MFPGISTSAAFATVVGASVGGTLLFKNFASGIWDLGASATSEVESWFTK